MTKATGTFHNYVNVPKQINGLSKSKTLLFMFQKVLCLIISYSYFGGINERNIDFYERWKLYVKK